MGTIVTEARCPSWVAEASSYFDRVISALIDDESADSYVRESAVSALSRLEQMVKFKGG